MWWSDRRRFLAGLVAGSGAALTLGGCGFTPVYGEKGTGPLLQGRIRAEEPDDTDSFVFASEFEKLLGGREDSPLELRYTINTYRASLAITMSQSILRYHLRGNVFYQVVDRETGKVLTQGRTESFIPYSAAGTTVATNAQANAAALRLMEVLAEQVSQQLLATANNWAK